LDKKTPAQLIFTLDIFSRIVREGYDSYYDGMQLTHERRAFRSKVEAVLRLIIQVVIHTLTHADSLPHLVVDRGLKFLRNAIAVVPAFELFNINLVDCLMKLLDSQDHEEEAFVCIREIFSFK